MFKLFLLLLIVTTSTAFAAADGGYLFVTFKGEQSPRTEQVYFVTTPDFDFPFRLRHGAVLPLTAEEMARILTAYAPPAK